MSNDIVIQAHISDYITAGKVVDIREIAETVHAEFPAHQVKAIAERVSELAISRGANVEWMKRGRG